MTERKVLITGGGGLIGQAIAREHIARGDAVYIWDDRSNTYNDYSSLVGIDLGIMPLSQVLQRVQPDIISHQAARVGVGESQHHAELYARKNVTFTADLFDILMQGIADGTVKRPTLFMHAGSMGPYGEGPRLCPTHGRVSIAKLRTTIQVPCDICGKPTEPIPITENDPLLPKSTYGITKKTQEELVHLYSSLLEIPAVSLRYFSVYGTNMNPTNPFTGVLSIIGNKIINSDEVDMYEDGHQLRDLIHADDVAKIHLDVTLQYNKGFKAMNVGTGSSHRMIDIAEEMVRILSPGKPVVATGKVRKGDIKDSQADIRQLQRIVGTKLDHTLEEDVMVYCKFLRDNWDTFVTKEPSWKETEDSMKRAGVL